MVVRRGLLSSQQCTAFLCSLSDVDVDSGQKALWPEISGPCVHLAVQVTGAEQVHQVGYFLTQVSHGCHLLHICSMNEEIKSEESINLFALFNWDIKYS